MQDERPDRDTTCVMLTSHLHNIIKNKWLLLANLLAVELILAYVIPQDILSRLVVLGELVNFLQYIAPVLGKITTKTAEHPEVVRCYIFITLSIMPIKVWIFFSWLNSDRTGIYRYLVISPLTDQKPAEGDNFIMDPLRQERKQAAKNIPRSLFSRFVWSTLILLFTFGLMWLILEFYSAPDAPFSEGGGEFRALVSEGFSMWSEWSLKIVTFTSFFLAVSFCIFRDYVICFKRTYNKIIRKA